VRSEFTITEEMVTEFTKGLLSKKKAGFKDTKAEWRHLEDVF